MAATKLTNPDIALYALYILGGAQRRVHVEDIALKCYELAPKRFSWTKYPQYPDIEPARSALEDAMKIKVGRLAKRYVQHTWMLTASGVDFVKERWDELSKPSQGQTQSSTERPRLESERFFVEFEKHPAYAAFQRTGSCDHLQPHEFTDFLKYPLDTPPGILKTRLETLKTRARDANKSDIVRFLTLCEERFPHMLAGSTEA